MTLLSPQLLNIFFQMKEIVQLCSVYFSIISTSVRVFDVLCNILRDIIVIRSIFSTVMG